MAELDRHQIPPLTVFEWVTCRQAHDMPLLQAIRCMLEEVEAGLIEIEERHRHGISLH